MNAATPISAPSGDITLRNRELISRLEKSRLFRDYRSAFETATGLPLVIRAAGSFQPPLAGSRQMNAFCALMVAQGKSCAACLDMQQRAEQESCGTCKTIECFAGLQDTVVPIRLGETVIAFLQTGQVMFHAPTERKFRKAVKQLEQWNTVGDVAELKAAYFRTRVLARPHYEATVRLLGSFSEHLSLLSNELMITEASTEPVAVSKARAFIAAHLDDDISLTEVARAANISTFYFCKVFKAAAGLTFTDYVARTRIEKTKQMLLDPQMRVSEAAFATGFQSLSQFNRVFRRITGESPMQYRSHRNDATSHRSLAFARGEGRN